MKICIVGSAGYIGRRLHPHLIEQGHDVRGIDIGWFGSINNMSTFKEDYSKTAVSVLSDVDVVILLAGHSSVGMCEGKGRSAYQNNVSNFIQLMDIISKDQILIYASSSSVYDHLLNPVESNARYHPRNFYDLTKHTIDQYALISNHPKWYGLRFGTVCGGSPNLRTDVMINAMYHSAMTTGVITYTNPVVSRPLLGLPDLCRAMDMFIAGTPKPGIYNVASGNFKTDLIAKKVAFDLSVPVVFDERYGTTYDFTVSVDKILSTGFSFRDNIESIVADIKEHYPTAVKTTRREPKEYSCT